MAIRRKVLLNIILVFVCLILVIFFISRYIMLENLIEVENKITRENIERVNNALLNVISNMVSTTDDWASWDDTYEFIEDGNEGYIQSNLADETFIGLDLNLMIFIDTSGHTIYAKAYDLVNYRQIPVTDKVETYFSGNDVISDSTYSDGGVSGIVYPPDIPPLLLVSRPILTSQDEGPPRGTLIFGRFFENDLISHLCELTSFNIDSYSVVNNDMPDDIRKVYLSLLRDSSIQARILDEQYIAGYSLINDIYGNPGLIIEITQPREIYQEGQLGISYLLLALIVTGIIFYFISMILANKQGLTKLKNIVDTVEDIGRTGNISERIPAQGDDEMAILAEQINGMLGALQEVYEKEAQVRYNLEIEMKRRIDFTRALVHELKTPLTPLLTSSDILVSEISTEPYLSLAKNINRGAVRLENRINELLDLAKGEIGTLELSVAKIDPLELLQNIMDEMKPLASNQGITLKLETAPSLPSLRGDEERLRQVLLNLLNNACRFTPEDGIITVTAKVNDNLLYIEVQDTGPGVPEEELEKVFLPYYRSDKENKRYGGLGLGLALSKVLIELHRGNIWARNLEGKGSIFGFSVPLDTTETGRES